MNYYVLLGIAQDADAATIRRAFRALARRYHPDAGKGSSAEKFRELVTAYETLIDANRRHEYNRRLAQTRPLMPRVVEPLRARPAPEPMRNRTSTLPGAAAPSFWEGRWRVVRAASSHEPPSSSPIDRLLDEFERSLDDLFFR